jgi:hypothetical protein
MLTLEIVFLNFGKINKIISKDHGAKLELHLVEPTVFACQPFLSTDDCSFLMLQIKNF